MYEFRIKYNFWFSLLAVFLVCLFSYTALAPAYSVSGGANLGVQSIFGPISGKGMRDEDILKYYLLSLLETYNDVNSIPGDMNVHLDEVDTDISLKFLSKKSSMFKDLLAAGSAEHIIQGHVNDVQYFMFINYSEPGSLPEITVMPEKEAAKIMRKNTILDVQVVRVLEDIILKDAYISENLLKLSKGAGLNLKLKAYYLLYIEQKTPEEVIPYIRKRIAAGIIKEDILKGQPSIGIEVEIWKHVKGYLAENARELSRIIGMELDKDAEKHIAIEFSPQPARDWSDMAEMIDTMVGIGMIPEREGEVFSLHISISRPWEFEAKDRNYIKAIQIEEDREKFFNLAVKSIMFTLMYLTAVDKRLLQTDFPTGDDPGLKRGIQFKDVIDDVKDEHFSHIAQYKQGNVVVDEKLEFNRDKALSSHRRALRMVQLLQTALLAYLKDHNKDKQDKLLSAVYKNFHREFKKFLNDNGLKPFKYTKFANMYIETNILEDEIRSLRQSRPELFHELEKIVEKHVALIENIRSDPVYSAERRPAGSNDLKGPKAKETNTVIRELLKKNRFVEIEYDGIGLGAWLIKDLGDKYQPGVTPEEDYRAQAVNIDKILNDGEQHNLINWIKLNILRSPPGGVRNTNRIRFRVALNQTSLKWNRDFEHSNVAHAGYYDRAIYIGQHLLSYILDDSQTELRRDILTNDEFWHLQDRDNRTHYSGDFTFLEREGKIKNILDLLVKARNRSREENSFLDLSAVDTLNHIVLKDPYIAEHLPKLSEGAGINLKLKAYQMLLKKQKPPEDITVYLKRRINEGLIKEKNLEGEPSVGVEVEIWKDIEGYSEKNARILAGFIGINLDRKAEESFAIEFAPQPARDWRDMAELVDTMIDIGMIPERKGALYPFHISVSRPNEFREENGILNVKERHKIKAREKNFNEGARIIVFIESFLTSIAGRLSHSDFPSFHAVDLKKEIEFQNVVKGVWEKYFNAIAEYKQGNVVTDIDLEFRKDRSLSSHRRSLKMVQLLQTALLARLKINKRNRREKLLSDIYMHFHHDFKKFLIDNGLSSFIYDDSSDEYIGNVTSTERLTAIRIKNPGLFDKMEKIVDSYLDRIEKVRDDPVLKEEEALDKGGAVKRFVKNIRTSVYDHGSAQLGLSLDMKNDEKVILALDKDLGKDGSKRMVLEVMKSMAEVYEGDELQKRLKNIIVIKGRGKGLVNKVLEYTGSGKRSERNRNDLKKYNVVMVTRASNKINAEKLNGDAIVTLVDDSVIGIQDYFPIVELTLYTLAKALHYRQIKGYDAGKLKELYGRLNAEEIVEDKILSRTVTVILKPSEPFEYDQLKQIYKSIQAFLVAA